MSRSVPPLEADPMLATPPQAAESLHCDAGAAGRDHGGLLARAVGEQLHHCRNAHQAPGDGPGECAWGPQGGPCRTMPLTLPSAPPTGEMPPVLARRALCPLPVLCGGPDGRVQYAPVHPPRVQGHRCPGEWGAAEAGAVFRRRLHQGGSSLALLGAIVDFSNHHQLWELCCDQLCGQPAFIEGGILDVG